MELDFDKFCVVDGSPTTVLRSSRRHSKVDKKTVKGYSECQKEELCSNEDFTDINIHRFRSVSCKTSSRAPLDYNEVRKRSSVYQSSKEVRLMKKNDPEESRKKIEVFHTNANFLPFGIVEFLCGSDEDNWQVDQRRTSVMAFNSDFSVATSSKDGKELLAHDHFDLSFCPVKIRSVPADNFMENPIHSHSTDYAEAAQRMPVKDQMLISKPVVVPVNVGNTMLERDLAMPLHKSLSAKLALPHSPYHSESDSSRASSPKTRFGPVRKVFDPFVKSKSLRSPLSSSVEPPRENPNKPVSISQNKTLRKSLLHDFSNMGKRVESESWSSMESLPHLVQSTPAHLLGLLKLNKKQGLPSFEFTLKFPGDVLVAKTWKAENGLNWIYTFHSVHERRKSNASGRGSKESHKVSSVVGQMQVSCYLCAEPKEFGALDHSLVTEFVLYDIAQQRKSVSFRDNPCCPTVVSKESKVSNEHSLQGYHKLDEVLVKSKVSKVQGQTKHDRESFHSDSSAYHPLAAVELNPHFQIGAAVVQVPYEKRESLKIKSGDNEICRPLLNVLESSDVEERRERVSNCSRAANVTFVVPSGNHGLPTTESQCPSPLLDRWRSGGGCDCGGWDMACPINIFSNPSVKISEDRLLITDHQPMELFVQGRRDNTPALTLKVLEDSQYAVDFHAQLSTLQAFSICVAVLHAMESSVTEQTEQLLQCDSLRMFLEEEVKSVMNAVTEEGKCKENKRMEAVLPSFVINPPFSPIERV